MRTSLAARDNLDAVSFRAPAQEEFASAHPDAELPVALAKLLIFVGILSGAVSWYSPGEDGSADRRVVSGGQQRITAPPLAGPGLRLPLAKVSTLPDKTPAEEMTAAGPRMGR
jgi:hypothetical protein